MESVQAYWRRKEAELALLARLAGVSLPATGASIASLIAAKGRLRAEILAREARRHSDLTETERRKAEIHRVGRFRVRYGYARYDLHVTGPPVYPVLPPPRGTLYAVGGMAAISATVLGLARLGRRAIEALPGSYFETQHVITEIAPGLSLSLVPAWQGRGTLLVDSYVKANRQRVDRVQGLRTPDLIVFDTTCYVPNSRRIGAVVNWALARDVPVVCLRSHLKLDQLGMEYFRLGSAAFFGQGSLLADLMAAAEDTVRTLGSGVPPVLLPPFQGDPEYQALGERRIACLRANCRHAVRSLRPILGAALSRYHHELFFAIDVARRDQSLADAADALANALRERGVPARRSGSFGHDFIAVDDYVDVTTETPVVRCAMADLPDEVIAATIDAIAGWWRALRPAS